MPAAEAWRGRLRTVRAMALLCGAWLVVRTVSFNRWRNSLGYAGKEATDIRQSPDPIDWARRAARNVERAAARLPFETKCLPRAMTLSWMLRRRQIRHAMVFAVRPSALRNALDDLHAWVEIRGVKVIGDLPGPWAETLRLGI